MTLIKHNALNVIILVQLVSDHLNPTALPASLMLLSFNLLACAIQDISLIPSLLLAKYVIVAAKHARIHHTNVLHAQLIVFIMRLHTLVVVTMDIIGTSSYKFVINATIPV